MRTFLLNKSNILWILIPSIVYLLILFPNSYFRHDDWIIIDEGVRTLHQWSLAFEPTAAHGYVRQPWFFRPFFKLGALSFLEIFGFHYYLWLSVCFGFFMASIYLGAKALTFISSNQASSLWFTTLFATAFQLHLGSLIWIGEGLMNCPQLFLLSLSLYFFCMNRVPASKAQWASLIPFALSLGFKESSLFHLFLLGGLVMGHPFWSRLKLKTRFGLLLPFGLVGLAYLLYRQIYVPTNPSYLLSLHWHNVPKSLLKLSALHLLPFALYLLIVRPKKLTESYRGSQWLIPFILLNTVPFIGHNFFSPGWLMVPGFFFLFCFCSYLPTDGTPIKKVAVSYLLCTLLLIGTALYQSRWFTWKPAQVTFTEEIRNSSTEVETIFLHHCYGDYQLFSRVIGGKHSMESAWHAIHRTQPKIEIDNECISFPKTPKQLHLYWGAPKLLNHPETKEPT